MAEQGSSAEVEHFTLVQPGLAVMSRKRCQKIVTQSSCCKQPFSPSYFQHIAIAAQFMG